MTKNYTLATERNGIISPLDLPPMAMRQAEAHAQQLRKLIPSMPIYVINANTL